MSLLVSMLAQAEGGAPTGAPAGAPPALGLQMWVGILLMFVVFYFVVHRGNRKEQKKREQMLAAMAKNDRVMTIGGIVGTVVSLKDTEVVLKVDESTNTKMTFQRKAIQSVMKDDEDLKKARA